MKGLTPTLPTTDRKWWTGLGIVKELGMGLQSRPVDFQARVEVLRWARTPEDAVPHRQRGRTGDRTHR